MSPIILDTETTGFVEPQAIEVAWVMVNESLSPSVEFVQRYCPSKPIECSALAIHHIMDEDLVGLAPSGSFVLPPETEYLIGHNIDYDWAVLGKPAVKRIDTLVIARMLWPGASHTLGALMYLLHRSKARDWLRDAHSAAADVRFCLYLLQDMQALLGEQGRCPATWEEWWLLSEQCRIPTIMPVGKHKGMPIAQVPADYKRWFLGQPDVDPYLRRALGGSPEPSPVFLTPAPAPRDS